jgi:hypothetical protein
VAVEIVLSENQLHTLKKNSKRTLNNPEVERLFGELVWAGSALEFKQISIFLRELVTKGSAEEFLCQHPNWFDETAESAKLVDRTVCDFCGYRQLCERAVDNLSVKILGVSMSEHNGIPLSPEDNQSALERCFQGINQRGESTVIDPFLGFSPLANSSRFLYLIPYASMVERFPDMPSNQILHTAIGYDLKSAQSIWPSDIRILQLLMDKSVLLRLKKSLKSGKRVAGNLTKLDELSLRDIARQRQWNMGDTGDEFVMSMQSMFEKIIQVLKALPEFKPIAMTPMKPFVDHPFNSSGSGWLIIAVRILELHPQVLEFYLNHHPEDALFLNRFMPDSFERRGGLSVQLDHEEQRRFVPRFPAVLLCSEDQVQQVELELSSCRVVRTQLVSIPAPCLLIDPLDFDLNNLQGWNFA